MPNRFAWIAAAVVLTTIGIVTAPAEYVSPKVTKRKVHRHRGPAKPAEVKPTGPKMIDLTYIPTPDGVTLPNTASGDVFLPDERARLLVIPAKDTGAYALSTEAPASRVVEGATPAPPATRKLAEDDAASALTKLVEEVKGLQLVVVADASVTWRPRMHAVLEAAAKARLPVVFFAVAAPDGEPGLRTYKYTTYPMPDGDRLAVLPGRDDEPLDGGVVRVDLVGGKPVFRFGPEQETSPNLLAPTIGDWHDEYLESAEKGARYADSGRAWTVRPSAGAPWSAVLGAMATIRGAGVSRVGIEWPR